MEESILRSDRPFWIGDWQVFPQNNQIRRGETITTLEPRVMDVLRYLSANAGRVVTRDELVEHVWHKRIVTNDALTRTIVVLRKALIDKSRPVIKTVSKRGYCLVLPVRTTNGDDSDKSAHSDRSDRVVDVPKTKIDTNIKQPERRLVTVLQSKLVDIHALAECVDPEDVHEILHALQKISAAIADRYGGHIAQYTNGELSIYFGYPQAHEGDAERAVRTALEMIAAVEKTAVELRLPAHVVSMQNGVHTGLVVVGEISDGDQMHDRMSVVGDTPSISSMLCQAAKTKSVLIGNTTGELVQDCFDLVNCGAQSIQGHSRPITIHSVRNVKYHPDSPTSELSPLIGRDAEIELLLKRWQQSESGESQVVLLCADAGIGKSRILLGLQQRLKNTSNIQILLFCSPFHRNSTLYPVITKLKQALGFHPDRSSQNYLEKLQSALETLDMSLPETVPVLAKLLSIPTENRYPDFTPDPRGLKNQTLSVLLSLVKALIGKKPVLFIVEDAHWIDPTTFELIDLIINELACARIMIVASYRPQFDPSWSGYMQATLLRLNRLGRRESIAIVNNTTGGKHLPEQILEQIVAKTDGVPLFIEELTRSVLASGALEELGDNYVLKGSPRPFQIPESLQDSLMARLDKLEKSKHVAQLAAILGRSFSHELLAAVTDENEKTLQTALEELQRSELLIRRGVPPNLTYEFKHALVQNAAYESMLKSTRQRLHRKISDVLQRRFNGMIEAHPEVLAHHYTQANLVDQAIAYWLIAGQQASKQSAYKEAIAHLNKGFELLDQLAENNQRFEYELRLLLALGPALITEKGMGAQGAEKVYQRARELCQQFGDTIELFTVTWGLWLICQKRGRLDEALGLTEELLTLSEQTQQADFNLQAHHAAWATHYRLSNMDLCWRYAKQGLDLYNEIEHANHASRFGGHDPGVCAYNHAAMNLWLRGFPRQAIEYVQHSVLLAQRISQPLSLVLAHVFKAFIHQCCGMPQQVRECTELVMSICSERAIAPDCFAQAKVLHGWANSLPEADDESMAIIAEGIRLHRNTGVRTHEPYLLTVFADSCLRAGKPATGLQTVEEALLSINKSGERTFEAEVLRLRGELLLFDSDQNNEDALDCFRMAIESAQRFQCKSLELRTAMSLSRFYCNFGDFFKARRQLDPVYTLISQGGNSADLVEAASLLAELEQTRRSEK